MCLLCGVGSVVLTGIVTQIHHRRSVIHYPQLGVFDVLRWNYLVILQYILSRKYKLVGLDMGEEQRVYFSLMGHIIVHLRIIKLILDGKLLQLTTLSPRTDEQLAVVAVVSNISL
jgi:hypothetical protein